MRGAKRKRERRVQDEQGYAPTPETVAKLRTDTVQRLHRQGRLTIEQLQAAEEIRRVWEAVGRGLFPTAAKLEGVRRSAAGQPRHPIDRMSDGEERAFRRRYRPWAREMERAPVARSATAGRMTARVAAGGGAGRGLSCLQLVYDMVIDNYGPRQVEQMHRLRHGLAMQGLRLALQRYAEIAEWVRPGRTGREGAVSASRQIARAM